MQNVQAYTDISNGIQLLNKYKVKNIKEHWSIHIYKNTKMEYSWRYNTKNKHTNILRHTHKHKRIHLSSRKHKRNATQTQFWNLFCFENIFKKRISNFISRGWNNDRCIFLMSGHFD